MHGKESTLFGLQYSRKCTWVGQIILNNAIIWLACVIGRVNTQVTPN